MSSTPSPQDLAWIAGLRAGRVDVFQMVYETHVESLWVFARRFVPNDVADDVVQDVMADLWRRHDVIDIRGTVAQYLFGAVYRAVLKHWRRERMVNSVERQYDTGIPPGMGEPPTAPDENMIGEDLKAALTRAFSGLSKTQRSVIELRWLHRMKYEQIAEVLGISVDAAWQHVSRAQRVVRPLIGRFLKGL